MDLAKLAGTWMIVDSVASILYYRGEGDGMASLGRVGRIALGSALLHQEGC